MRTLFVAPVVILALAGCSSGHETSSASSSQVTTAARAATSTTRPGVHTKSKPRSSAASPTTVAAATTAPTSSTGTTRPSSSATVAPGSTVPSSPTVRAGSPGPQASPTTIGDDSPPDLSTGAVLPLGCADQGNGTVKWRATISMADGEHAIAGPYIQAYGTTVTEPPITLPKVIVQVRMQIPVKHSLFPCITMPLIVHPR